MVQDLAPCDVDDEVVGKAGETKIVRQLHRLVDIARQWRQYFDDDNGIGCDHRRGRIRLAAIHKRIGLVTRCVVDYDCKAIDKGLARDSGLPDRGVEGNEGALLGPCVVRSLRCHGDDLAANEFVVSLILGFRPGEEFENGHAPQCRSIHSRHIGTIAPSR
jgi:hypothetical protein